MKIVTKEQKTDYAQDVLKKIVTAVKQVFIAKIMIVPLVSHAPNKLMTVVVMKHLKPVQVLVLKQGILAKII